MFRPPVALRIHFLDGSSVVASRHRFRVCEAEASVADGATHRRTISVGWGHARDRWSKVAEGKLLVSDMRSARTASIEMTLVGLKP